MGQKLGAPPPFGGEELGPHLTQRRYNVAWADAYSLPSGILIHPAIWRQISAENWGLHSLLGEGSWVPI